MENKLGSMSLQNVYKSAIQFWRNRSFGINTTTLRTFCSFLMSYSGFFNLYNFKPFRNIINIAVREWSWGVTFFYLFIFRIPKLKSKACLHKRCIGNHNNPFFRCFRSFSFLYRPPLFTYKMNSIYIYICKWNRRIDKICKLTICFKVLNPLIYTLQACLYLLLFLVKQIWKVEAFSKK